VKVDIQNNLSFLDTLSCGLGGLMALFFIFAALKDEGAVAAKTIPVLIRGENPLPVLRVGTDKKQPPVHFSLKLATKYGCKLAIKGDEKQWITIGESNGFNNKVFIEAKNLTEPVSYKTFFGTYWGKQDKDIVVSFDKCDVDSGKPLIEVMLVKKGAGIGCENLLPSIEDRRILKIKFKVTNGQLIKVNNTKMELNNEKRC
jgi:hypothetical protein